MSSHRTSIGSIDDATMEKLLAGATMVDGKPIAAGTAREALKRTPVGSSLIAPKRGKPKMPVKLIEPGFKTFFNGVEFTLAVKLEMTGNNRGVFNAKSMGRPAKYRWAWFSRLPAHLQDTIFLIEAAQRGELVYVTITRIGHTCDDDNLQQAAKELRDAVALSFGQKDDRSSPLKFDYQEERRAFCGARVRLSLDKPIVL